MSRKHNRDFRPDSILAYFRLEWLPIALITVSGLIYNIGLLAGPWFEGRLAQCLADILGGSETASAMAALAAGYIVVTLIVQASRFVKRFYVRRFANNINRRMKGVLYANLVRQSRGALEEQGAGELMTKAISDVDDCAEGMRKFTTEIFDTGVALVGYVVMLFVYDWRLALLCMIFTPVSYVCAELMKKPVQHAGAAYKKAASALSAATLDRAKNAVTYRVYGCEDVREARYEKALTDYEKNAALQRLAGRAAAALSGDLQPERAVYSGLARKTCWARAGARGYRGVYDVPPALRRWRPSPPRRRSCSTPCSARRFRGSASSR
ncbi:MAG: ABC transporter transmembrane domain-containing protein [Christensenellales bacterium]